MYKIRQNEDSIPVVMTFTGSDATGGSGLQADIETLLSMGCHCTPILTDLSVRDTEESKGHEAIATSLVISQARAILEDVQVHAFKVSMVSSIDNLQAIYTLLSDYPDTPIILDPSDLLTNQQIMASDFSQALTTLLCPLAKLMIVNSQQVRLLAPDADTLDACAQQLLGCGSEYLLITGTSENTPTVTNTLYGNHRLLERFSWQRLPYSYHGSGCTLSAASAGLIAQGLEVTSAIHEAQEYTWETLKHSYRIGMGQHIPNRLYWAHHRVNQQ